MRTVVLLCLAGTLSASAVGTATVWKADDLRKSTALNGKPFASESLGRFGNHYALLAHRQGKGQAEVHEIEADLFMVESGTATLITGGRILNGKTAGSHEIRGEAIQGGQSRTLEPGDIVHVPAGVPHQLVAAPQQEFTYFVLKVKSEK